MTEYWKSNPRHWCDVCKVWLDAKKMSIKHHEAGAKHKEKAAAKMKDMRRTRLDREFKEREAEMEMKRIEMAAMKAHRADMYQAVSLDDLRGGDSSSGGGGEVGDGSGRPLKMARTTAADGIGPAGPPPGVVLKPRFPPGMFPPKSKESKKKDDPFSYTAPEEGEESTNTEDSAQTDMPALEGSSSGETTAATDAAAAAEAEAEAEEVEEAPPAPIDESTGLGEWQTVEVSMFGDAKPSKKMKQQNRSRDAPRHWATETPRLPKVGKGAFDGPSKTLYEDDDEDPAKDDSVAAEYGYSALVGGKTEERYEVPEDDEDQPSQPVAFKKRKSRQPKPTRSALS